MALLLAKVMHVGEEFNQTAAVNNMQEIRHYSFYISAFYVLTIFGIQKFMKNRQRYNLRNPLMVWSLALSVFSFCGFWKASLFHWGYLLQYGWKGSVCDEVLVQRHVNLWSYLFILSKLPELVDTYFIVLRKQKLIFLHWYHHITVFIYCWYSYSEITNAQQWFISMNYFVHSIMYMYYAIRASSVYRPPVWVNMFITSLQLTQMVVGVAVNLYVFLNMHYTPGWYCDGKVETTHVYVGAAFVMYASYFVLFANFFYSAYVTKRLITQTHHAPTSTNHVANHSACNGVAAEHTTLASSLPDSKVKTRNGLRHRD
jgi:elongation of very long chain fatty acids protein 6